MDDDRFEAYVKEWTARAAHDLPAARRAAKLYANASLVLLPVALLVCAAVALCCAVASLFLLVSGPWVVLFLTVPLSAAGAVASMEMWKSLVFRFPAPDGVRAGRTELPELWSRIDRVAAATGARAPQYLVIERGCEAYAASHAPSLLSPSTAWLGLGLPLLVMLEPDELDSVIAHELAHIDHRDGAALRRTRRALVTWDALADRLAYRSWKASQPGAGRIETWTVRLLRWTLVPLGRVIPQRLGAIERAVAREHELAADFVAARALSPEASARALVRLHAIEPFWADVAMRSYDQALLAGDTPSQHLPIENALKAAEPIDAWTARMFLAADLAQPDHWSREHPALERRLVMLGIGIDRPAQQRVSFEEAIAWATAPPTGTVWRECFEPPTGQRVLERVGAAWRAETRAGWSESRPLRVKHEEEMRELDARARRGTLRAREYVQLAEWVRRAGDRAASRTWLGWALQVDQYHGEAAGKLGTSMLYAGDPGGLRWLEHASALGPDLRSHAAHMAAAWYRAHGDVASSTACIASRDAAQLELRGMAMTPSSVMDRAPIAPMPPSEREAALLYSEVGGEHDVDGAWVARLKVPDPPLGRYPIFVIVQVRAGSSTERCDELRERLLDDLRAAWFASDVDQWFVQVCAGPCPPETFVGRIESSPACRVPGIGGGGAVVAAPLAA
ncbi:MAG: hypothetical protein JWO69_54 [Thermoleophilia bacterium]|nr:hypothetical protein [Thermoleophilia bacterium]